MLDNLTPEQIDNLIAAGTGLIGAVVGAGATLLSTWLTKKLQTSGKVSLFAKIVHLPTGDHRTWGYYPCEKKQGLYMMVPLWLDVCNTSGIPRILRNVNLSAYSDKKEIAPFTQMQRSGDGEKAVLFGEQESYTLVIPANSAKRFDLVFMLHEAELMSGEKDFDKLILTYFDEKNQIHAFHLAAIERCWVRGSLPKPKEWMALSRRCRYAR